MKVDSICIVGGGTAGWMAAATFTRLFPEKHITLLESEDIPTIGVGESTTQFFRGWLDFIELYDVQWMDDCDATYKYSVRFENFNRPNCPFHYPFISNPDSVKDPKNIPTWFIHQALTGESVDGFAAWIAPHMKAIEEGRIITEDFDRFVHERDTGFHMDAIKFARWLKYNVCYPGGINHMSDVHIVKHKKRKDGTLEWIQDKNGRRFYADLFVDCTGFKSLLINDYMKTGWEDFNEMLPNDRAWTVRLPYTNKREQMKTYTNCTALDNGWVWNVPLQNRIGTGYNYSSKFISDADALEEFKKHLGYPEETLCDYRNIKFKTGLSKKPWNKNVLAIGLSGGFIEPLESNGLLSVHEWLIWACQIIGDGAVRAIDINAFNYKARKNFKSFAHFVFYHYAFSKRNDTPYWKYMTEDYDALSDLHNEFLYDIRNSTTPLDKIDIHKFTLHNYGGESYIAAGHDWNPFNHATLRLLESRKEIDLDSYIEISDYSQYNQLIETFPYASDYYEN